MDYETRIYLEKLIGAVDSPDWWSIGITAVNALIVVGLTIWQLCLNRKQTKIQERQNELQEQQLKIQERQNELQEQQIKLQEQQNQLQKVQTELMEQQTKAQEYVVYKPMFSLVRGADEVAKNLLNYIYNYFSVPIIRVIDKEALLHHKEYVQQLEKGFRDTSMDFELKFNPNDVSIYTYLGLLEETHRTLQLFVNMETDGQIKLVEDDNESNAVLLSHRANDESIIIDAIVKRIGDKKLQQGVKNSLIGYLAHRKSVMALGIADKIKDRITPNNKG